MLTWEFLFVETLFELIGLCYNWLDWFEIKVLILSLIEGGCRMLLDQKSPFSQVINWLTIKRNST